MVQPSQYLRWEREGSLCPLILQEDEQDEGFARRGYSRFASTLLRIVCNSKAEISASCGNTQPKCHYWLPWNACSTEEQVRNQCSEELGSSGALRGALDLGSTRAHFCFLKMLMFYFIFKALNFFFTRLFIFLALCNPSLLYPTL